MTRAPLRSLLYVPGHVERLVPKAARTGADVVILDLEDAVPPSEKEGARQMLAAAAAHLRAAGKSVAVRVNNDSTSISSDLMAAAKAGADYVVLPKLEDPSFVQWVAGDALAGHDDLHLIGLIETPRGLLNAPEIAAAHQKLVALNLGTEDFCTEMGMEPDWDGLLSPSQQIVTAARAAGKIPLGYAGSIAQYQDLDAFQQIAVKSAKLGFEGGFAIHPSQVPCLNAAYTPSEAAISQARRIVQVFEQSLAEGFGAVSLDDRMIDLPVVERARRVLLRA